MPERRADAAAARRRERTQPEALDRVATAVLQEEGAGLAMLFADLHLGGGSGLELARLAKRQFPDLHVVIASGDTAAQVPDGARFMLKPWRPLDLLREAGRSVRY